MPKLIVPFNPEISIPGIRSHPRFQQLDPGGRRPLPVPGDKSLHLLFCSGGDHPNATIPEILNPPGKTQTIRNFFCRSPVVHPLYLTAENNLFCYHKKNPAFAGLNFIRSTLNFLHGRQLNLLLQFNHTLPEQTVRIHQVLYSLTGMDNRSMIPSAKMFADGF